MKTIESIHQEVAQLIRAEIINSHFFKCSREEFLSPKRLENISEIELFLLENPFRNDAILGFLVRLIEEAHKLMPLNERRLEGYVEKIAFNDNGRELLDEFKMFFEDCQLQTPEIEAYIDTLREAENDEEIWYYAGISAIVFSTDFRRINLPEEEAESYIDLITANDLDEFIYQVDKSEGRSLWDVARNLETLKKEFLSNNQNDFVDLIKSTTRQSHLDRLINSSQDEREALLDEYLESRNEDIIEFLMTSEASDVYCVDFIESRFDVDEFKDKWFETTPIEKVPKRLLPYYLDEMGTLVKNEYNIQYAKVCVQDHESSYPNIDTYFPSSETNIKTFCENVAYCDESFLRLLSKDSSGEYLESSREGTIFGEYFDMLRIIPFEGVVGFESSNANFIQFVAQPESSIIDTPSLTLNTPKSLEIKSLWEYQKLARLILNSSPKIPTTIKNIKILIQIYRKVFVDEFIDLTSSKPLLLDSELYGKIKAKFDSSLTITNIDSQEKVLSNEGFILDVRDSNMCVVVEAPLKVEYIEPINDLGFGEPQNHEITSVLQQGRGLLAHEKLLFCKRKSNQNILFVSYFEAFEGFRNYDNVEALVGVLKEGVEGMPLIGLDTLFLKAKTQPFLKEDAPTLWVNKLIGFKNSRNFFKNSNFIAYSYLYVFMVQIAGRFAEHAQNDLISQRLPLGAIFKVYSQNENFDSPARFLKFAQAMNVENRTTLVLNSIPFSYQCTSTHNYLAAYDKEDSIYVLGLRYLYSFIDTYTRPLVLLYNALQFSISPRSNPTLRFGENSSTLAGNYSYNYSEVTWVNDYLDLISKSQAEDFYKKSLLTQDDLPSAQLIAEEIERFHSKACISEFEMFETLFDLDKMEAIFHLDSDERPKALQAIKLSSAIYERLQNHLDIDHFKDVQRGEAFDVFDFDGLIPMGVFSQQLSFCITAISKFISFVYSPLVVDSEFKTRPFFEIFLSKPQDSDSVKHRINLESIFDFPIEDSHLKKLKKNNSVNVIVAGKESRLPICLANLDKNVIPYEAIRRALLVFKSTHTFVPMGIDERTKLPQGNRLSLGAFLSIFSILSVAQERFMKSRAQNIYGELQAYQVAYEDMGVDSEPTEFVQFGEAEDLQLTIRQATCSYSEYQDSFEKATDEQIKERFVDLTSTYQICIGQSGMGYIGEAQNGVFEVFTLFSKDKNFSTLGFRTSDGSSYSIEDTKGGNNNQPWDKGTLEDHQMYLNWLMDLFFTYCIREEDFIDYVCGNQLYPNLLTGENARDLDLDALTPIFEINQMYVSNNAELIAKDPLVLATGFCTRLHKVLSEADVLERFENVEDLVYKLQTFTEYLKKKEVTVFSRFFELFYSVSENSKYRYNFKNASLMDNGIRRRYNARFDTK